MLLEEAKQYDSQGKPDQALQRLERLTSAFPKTAPATLAREARERHARGLPLFADQPVYVAARADPPPPTSGPSNRPGASRPAEVPAPPAPATAELPPPPVLPEPYQDTLQDYEQARITPRPLPTGFRARPEAGVHLSGWPWEITCDRDGSAMRLVPGGPFTMGYDRGRPSERPEHPVILGTYYIDQHEITNHQYYYLYRLSRPGEADPSAESVPPDNDHPVVNVTLAEARDYAEWAGKALPTEAQWEKAGRWPDDRRRPWGQGPPPWERPRRPRQIDPIMTYTEDLAPCGVFDLAGNAWEWTSDWFDTHYFSQFRDQPAIDPTGAPESRARIPEITVKGGSADWQVPWRSGMRREARLPYLGFRCVLSVEQAAPPTPPVPAPNPARPPAQNVPAHGLHPFRSDPGPISGIVLPDFKIC